MCVCVWGGGAVGVGGWRGSGPGTSVSHIFDRMTRRNGDKLSGINLKDRVGDRYCGYFLVSPPWGDS